MTIAKRIAARLAAIAVFVTTLTIAGGEAGAQPVRDTSMLSQPVYKVIREQDVEIPTRDGAYLMADIFRPDPASGPAAGPRKFPVIMSLSAYQKDLEVILPYGKPPFTHRETPEPGWWVPRGYVLIRIDTRGTGKTPGRTDIWSMAEARDYYDAIEWAARQDWSTDKVGLGGVSYYAITQWNVASLQPPSLTAILPWEGWSDMYRDAVFQGGVFNLSFLSRWWNHVRARQLLEATRRDNPAALEEPLLWRFMAHPFDGPWWDQVKARAQMEKITVPFYSAGNWGGWNHHMRGNIEAYLRAASEHKKLQMHIGGHTDHFFAEEGKVEQLRWFDYWLKDIDTGIMDEPPVVLCIRTTVDDCTWRYENEWPLARTRYTQFYLQAMDSDVLTAAEHGKILSASIPQQAGRIDYDASPDAYLSVRAGRPGVLFMTAPLHEDIEITGHPKLVLWAESETEDMHIFAYLREMAPDGTLSPKLTRGILKASRRRTDPDKSTAFRPWHLHTAEDKLTPGEPVRMEVEILPTSKIYRTGHRIVLQIDAHDRDHYDGNYQTAGNSIHTGGDMPSYLVLPIIPAE